MTPTDINQIPNGELIPVKNSPFDFTSPHRIGERVGQVRELSPLAIRLTLFTPPWTPKCACPL